MNYRSVVAFLVAVSAVAAPTLTQAQEATKRIRVAWCSKTISAAVAPFAVATKLGWFREGGIEIDLVTFQGSTDCVKNLAIGEVLFSHSAPEAVALMRTQGVDQKIFFSAYLKNIYGLAVHRDSPIRTYADLRDQRIGVTAMGSVGVNIAKALAKNAGLDPEKDIRIVVVGEPAQSAAMIRNGQVAVLSQFDTNYALIERAGVPLRRLDNSEIARFPSNGLVALNKTLIERRKDAVAFARAYAMGTRFAILNPTAAVRIVHEVYPQSRATGVDPEKAVEQDAIVLRTRIEAWKPEAIGISKWGLSLQENYAAYLAWLQKNGLLAKPVAASDLVTNALIDDINAFDAQRVERAARSFQ